MGTNAPMDLAVVFDWAGLNQLFVALRTAGYDVIGPTVLDGAIVYRQLDTADDLPVGWTDVQEAGTYRLERRDDQRAFGYVVGPHTWKRYLFPPREVVWSADRRDGAIIPLPTLDAPRYAFIGVRGCEMAAIAIQDQVFIGGSHPDAAYSRRRERAFIVAVHCDEPAPTCFCTSMGTGPRVNGGYDIALTERLTDGVVSYLAEAGSAAGRAVLAEVAEAKPATVADIDASVTATTAAGGAITRTLPADEVKEVLQSNLEHPHWNEIAERCLSCTNCTLVCPTCFCHAYEDSVDLDGITAARTRQWDSCFSLEFSFLHGQAHRASPAARYRQWLTHKLAGWIDQFGVSGCVGCGRCITWCPVGIDLTVEVPQFVTASSSTTDREGDIP